jgi:Flp pilus assembly protein TadG
MAVLVPVVGLGIDGATLYLVRAKLSQAIDASALAGARSLNTGADISSQAANAQQVATRFFYANVPPGFWGTTNASLNVNVAQNDATKVRTVTVTASVSAPLYFMSILNHGASCVLSLSGIASRRDVNVMLVLDRSGSMDTASAIPAMQSAATTFVNKFAAGRDKVGLATFGGSYFLAFHPATSFKTASPNVPTLIGQIVGGGSTNTAQALWLAYREIVKLGEPGALNAIVLFTDGRPTAFTADFQPLLKSPVACTYPADPKLGFLTYYVDSHQNPAYTAGLFSTSVSSITDVAEQTIANYSQGCHYSGGNWKNVYRDFSGMPARDYYGNATNGGYKTVDLTAIGQPSQVEAASTNAADAAAARIRADATYRPVIFAIGLGGTTSYPPDAAFMKRIANDPTGADYDLTEPAGLYAWSPTTAQLQQAFLLLASEILRLAQ